MSKKMGLSMISAFLPITVHAGEQLMKMGGGGGKGFFQAMEQVGKSWGGIQGFKNYFKGGSLGMKSGQLAWSSMNDTAETLARRTTRRSTIGFAGALGAMNLMVGDSGFSGTIKSGVNTGTTMALGYGMAPKVWSLANSRKTSLGQRSIKGAAIGVAGAWAANKMGII